MILRTTLLPTRSFLLPLSPCQPTSPLFPHETRLDHHPRPVSLFAPSIYSIPTHPQFPKASNVIERINSTKNPCRQIASYSHRQLAYHPRNNCSERHSHPRGVLEPRQSEPQGICLRRDRESGTRRGGPIRSAYRLICLGVRSSRWLEPRRGYFLAHAS